MTVAGCGQPVEVGLDAAGSVDAGVDTGSTDLDGVSADAPDQGDGAAVDGALGADVSSDPGFGSLCDPCTLSSQCGGAAGTTARCVDHDGNGAFCAMACGAGGGCPAKYTCRSVTTIEGSKASQCVPSSATKTSFGACACSDSATKSAKTTSCSISATTNGKTVACYGERTCAAGGLTPCSATAPSKEVCDGLDNDCDGSTDGGACDDGDACTVDSCDAKTKTCKSSSNKGPCDDGDVCTTGETCATGVCSGGKIKSCNDGNACTTDVCDKSGVCKNTAVQGCKSCKATADCNDSDPCTTDQCSSNACRFIPKICNDNDSCTIDSCGGDKGSCSYVFSTLACNSTKPLALPYMVSFGCGDASSALWTLDKPAAAGAPAWGFDDTPAMPKPAYAPCSLNFNNGTDFQCSKGAKAVSGSAVSPWIDATSLPSVGRLRLRMRYGGTYERNNNDELRVEMTFDDKTWNAVYDFQGLTSASSWSEPNLNLAAARGKVFRVRVRFYTTNCDVNTGTGPFIDRIWIKDDSCYTHADCLGGSTCSVRRCVNNSCNAANPCNDFNSCTSDSCNAIDGSCKHTNTGAGKACNDGDTCTSGTKCTAGTCGGGSIVKDGLSCDDGNGCTGYGACKGGSCNVAIACDDGNACTVDSCDKFVNKCVYLPAAGVCDDGNKCTSNDACFQGLCAGKATVCDDGNPCTSDACKRTTGVCTTIADSCDDGDSCTIDTCNKTTGGCTYAADKACAGGAILPYNQPFSCDGTSGWTLTGTAGGPAWAVDGTPVLPVAKSGKCSLNFNNGTDFQCPAGASSVSGTATSPWIDATAATSSYVRLTFNLSGTWENNNNDEFYVEYSVDDKKWFKLWESGAVSASAWSTRTLSFTQIRGKKFRLRFRFFTSNCTVNTGTGPFIDNIKIADLGCTYDKDCDDDNACTTHICNSNGYCSNYNKSCHDKDSCTTDSCNPSTGTCRYVQARNGSYCADGDACTMLDRCHGGKCSGIANVCDDGDKCTTGKCDTAYGCSYGSTCDDGDGCTLDTCDPTTQKCSSSAVATGSACVDDNACTGGEICGAKGCVGGVVTVTALVGSYSTLSDVVVHSSGAVYFTSLGYHRVYKVKGAGAVVFAGSTAGFVDGSGAKARFSAPRGLAVNAAGVLVVADSGNHRIRRIDATGSVTTLAGGKSGFKEGADGLLSNPYGVAFDSKGVVWVADTYNYRIRRLGAGGSITTVAGNSSGGFTDGQGVKARFYRPMGIDFDAKDNLFIADAYNNRIRKMTPSGMVTTVAGGSSTGVFDGPVKSARFYRPQDVAVAPGGAILVADAYNYRVRRITPTGIVSTLAGQKNAGYTNGNAAVARFNRPGGVSVHKDGTIYVADIYNGRVRILMMTSGDGKSMCDDGDLCTIDACNPVFGGCTHKQKSTCDDGKPCTDDGCLAATGVCESTKKSCDDGDSCTVDSCDAATGDCAYTAGTCANVVTRLGWKQPFTCGAKSLQKWTFSGNGGPSWAVDSSPGKPTPVSPACSLNFNNGVDYTCAAGAKKVEGSATSPWLDTSKVVAGGSIRLRFRYSGRWESNNNDELYVETTTDGKTWKLRSDLSWTSAGSWGNYNGVLDGVAGGKMKIRFRFSTVDCKLNGWQGPFIDDLSLVDENCTKASDCVDGNACTTATCASNNTCTFGGINCNDDNPCTSDSCVQASGCRNLPKADGAYCSDGDTCTSGDVCINTTCVGAATGKDGSSCSDGSNCTQGESCQKGKCMGKELCQDGNPCTKDSCTKGNCVYALDVVLCDDGDPCTVDVCDANGCSNGAGACDDGDSCTVDTCNGTTGACTFSKGSCFSGETRTIPWQAGFLCTGSGKSLWTFKTVSGGLSWDIDAAPAKPKATLGGCSLNLNNGKAVVCKAGETKVVSYATGPWLDATAIPKLNNLMRLRFKASGSVPNTGLVYRIEATTDEKVWKTIYTLSNFGSSRWYDRTGTLSNYAGTKFRLRFRFEAPCKNLSGTGPFIDALSIRDERCQEAAQCGDGNPCTLDRCVNGSCSYQGISCDDGNPCTTDSCSSTLAGCRNIPRNDDYACGLTASCIESRCFAGVCSKKKKASGQTCSDGDSCTSNGKCASDKCVGGTTISAAPIPCSDSDRCTTDDRCSSGGCSGKVGRVTTAVGSALSSPSGVALGADGWVYITSVGHNRIRRYGQGSLQDFAGTNLGYLDGYRKKARFKQPRGLDVGLKGVLYIADSGNARIRTISPGGIVGTLAGSVAGFLDGPSKVARFNGPTDVAADKKGQVFVADANNNRIRRISVSGLVTTLAGAGLSGFVEGAAAKARFNRPQGLAVDSAGVVFVADTYNSRIRRVSPNGTVSTFSGSGSYSLTDGLPQVARFNRPVGLQWAGGSLYVADAYNHQIRRVDSAGRVSTITGRQGYGFADGSLSGAKFAYPYDVVVDKIGTLYVADRSNARLRIIRWGGAKICDDGKPCTQNTCDVGTGRCDNGPRDCDDGNACTFDTCTLSSSTCAHKPYDCDDGNSCTVDSCSAKTGCAHSKKVGCEDCDSKADCDDDKPCTKDSCSSTTGCAHKAIPGCVGCGKAASCDDGNVCTIDACKAGTCSHLPASTGTSCNDGSLCTGDDNCVAGQCVGRVAELSYFAGSPGQKGTTDQFGAKARFTSPAGVAWHKKLGQIIVADAFSHRIRRVMANTQVYRLAGWSAGFKDGSASSSTPRFNRPADVAVTPDGIIWVADQLNHRIRRVDIMGKNLVSTVAGQSKAGFKDGKGSLALLNSPRGIAASADGFVLIADSGNSRIRRFAPKTTELSTIAGSIIGYVDGNANSARFSAPGGLDVGKSGDIFVADSGNHRIRRIRNGQVTTVAGGAVGFVNGAGALSRFNLPADVAVGANGNLFVADMLNHAIRRISTQGQVATVAGPGLGQVAGSLALARLNLPSGIALGANGDLWIVEQGSHTVRRLRSAGSPCGDGVTCTGDVCAAKSGTCVFGPALGSTGCDDNSPCTIDMCLAWTGKCLHTAVATGTACGGGRVCVAGACESQ